MIKVQNLRLQVDFIKEGDTYIAYSSALDISTCGILFLRHKKLRKTCTDIFAELIKMRTLDDVLSSLGWKRVEIKLDTSNSYCPSASKCHYCPYSHKLCQAFDLFLGRF